MTAQQKRTLRTEPMQLPFHDRLVRIVPEPTSLARDALLQFFPSQIDATDAVSYSGLLPFAAVKHRQTTCILNFSMARAIPMSSILFHVWAPLQTFTQLHLRHKACSH